MGNEPPPGPRRSASRWWNIVDDEPAPVAECSRLLPKPSAQSLRGGSSCGWLVPQSVRVDQWMGAGCTVVFACDCP